MIMNVSNLIEKYIKEIFLKNNAAVIEIRRNEMADRFECAPSQINYVMQTRFSLEKGYIVKSKRGGGGFIRIQKLDIPSQKGLYLAIRKYIGDRISQEQSWGLIQRLFDERIITARERQMLRVAVSRDVLNMEQLYRDRFRASLLSSMLIAMLDKDI